MRALMLLILSQALCLNLLAADSSLVSTASSHNSNEADSDDTIIDVGTKINSPQKNDNDEEILHTHQTPVAGITVKQAEDFLYDSQKIRPFALGNVRCWLWASLGIEFLVTTVPGITTTSLYCRNYPAILSCLNTCNNNDYTCTNACNRLNRQTLDDPVCKTGLVLTFLPLAAHLVVAACATPITRGLNVFVNRYNHKLKNRIRDQFTKGRPNDEQIIYDDVKNFTLGLLEKDAAVLGKLSPAQALAIAEVDWQAFGNFTDQGFSEAARIYAYKLQSLHADTSLGETLKDKNVHIEFKQEPALLQALIRTLPEEVLSSHSVQLGLRAALQAIQDNTNTPNKEYWDNAVDAIRQGTAIDTYISHEKSIVITKKNIWTRLCEAKNSKNSSLLGQCDTFILKQGLDTKLVQNYLEAQQKQDQTALSFKSHLEFCREFSLNQTKRHLIAQQIEGLNDISIDDAGSLNEVKLLDDQEFIDGQAYFEPKQFSTKLQNPRFLQWIWQEVKDITPLRDLVVEFCAQEKNHAIIQSAWVALPQDLQNALSEEN